MNSNYEMWVEVPPVQAPSEVSVFVALMLGAVNMALMGVFCLYNAGWLM